MQGDDKGKHAFNQIARSSSGLQHKNSFIDKMSIYANGFFERLPSESREMPIIPEQQVFVPKEEPHGNVFRGFKEEAQRVPEPKLNPSQTYERQCLEYEKYLFDSRIKMIIKRMAIKAYNIFKNEKDGQFFVFPIQRLLTTIAKKLLLNRFELFFLQYALEETKWRYDTDCIRRNAQHFKSYMMLPDSQPSNTEIKYMEVYILYCAYFSKKSLNELPTDNMFLTFCQDICSRFKEFFPEWTQISGMGAKINPKQLNNIFKKLTYNYNGERDHEEFQNYCLVVEEIIDISPAYNADKSGKIKKVRKSKKQPKNKQQQSPKNQQQQQSRNRLPEIIHQEQSFDVEPPIFRNKKSSVLSVDYLEAGYYITRSVSQHEKK